jgi:hypothetical protein
MDMLLLAEQLGNSVEALPELEEYYREHDKGELRLYLNQNLDEATLCDIEKGILDQGVVLTDHVVQDGGVLVIRFQKALAPLAIIAIVIGGIFAIGAALLGWQIFKSVMAGVPIWVWIAAGALVLYLIWTSETGKSVRRTVGRIATEAGETYVRGRASRAAEGRPRVVEKQEIIPPNHRLTTGGES